MPTTLIPAKLERPRMRRGIIARPELLARLDEALEGRITLISAPAGYGKSTAAAQWLAHLSAVPSAWISLDELDSDLERFLRYVVAALRTVDSTCLPRTESLLSAQTLPPPQHLAETVAAELAELGGRAILAFDDYGTIRGESVHELIRWLVPRLPDSLHLVIVTRIDPPLPLSLWRSRRWLRELRGGDLRFSRDEAGALFRSSAGARISDDAIAILHDKTEGWVAGLRLAQLSLVGAADPEGRVRAFSGSDRLIVDYLMEEALAAQPPEVREFLALTAPLERFSAPVCDHLLADRVAHPDSRRVIERLYRDNLFLIPLSAPGGWYRYHHLFRQLLLDRVDQMAPALRQEDVLRRAGEWFRREGWLEEGLRLLLDAGDVDGAADLVAEHLHEIIQRDLSRRTLGRWLAMFPPGSELGRVPLIVASLYMMILRWDFDGMLRLLHEADTTCRGLAGDRPRRWWQDLQPDLDALRGYALYWSGDIPGALDHLTRAVASSPSPQSYQHSLALLYYGSSLACTGRWSDYLDFLEEGSVRERAAGSPQVGPYLVVRACVHLYRGELDQCRDAAWTMVTAAAQVAIPEYWLGIAYYLLGAVAYERNLLDEAEAHFREGETMRFDTSPMFCHHLLLGLASVGVARGNGASTAQWAAAARDYALGQGSPTALQDTEWFERRLAFAAGDRSAARSQPPSVPDFMRLSVDAPSRVWAWLQLEDDLPDAWTRALRFIEEARERAEAHGVERQAIQLSVLRALALDRLGLGEQAVEEMESAVRRAEPHGFVRSFVDPGSRGRDLLRRVASRGNGYPYAETLLEAFDAAPGRAVRETAQAPVPEASLAGPSAVGAGQAMASGLAPGEALTNRELDVLELLQQRLTNKEIAARLSVTAETVRKHALNAYRKLGVHGRRQAVAEAIARGILMQRGS